MNCPAGTRYLSWAPWNEPDPELLPDECPNCFSTDNFECTTWVKGQGYRIRRFCKKCKTKF